LGHWHGEKAQMKLHVVTIGTPKLPYAKLGWDEYLPRLQHFHTIRVTQLNDKWAYDVDKLLETAGSAYKVALAIEGREFTSHQLANFLEKRSLDAKEVCLLVGGPNGLPQAILDRADMRWSFSPLTFPHDLAMVILLEALYRASTISSGQPYHR
jgi:23S rRNA (pseudouridine1915-N3)-methyltransferase